MNSLLRSALFIIAIVAVAFSSYNCNKSTIIGQNLLPGVDNVHTFETDTFTVIANTVYKFDSVAVNYGFYTMQVGGMTTDPIFGKTTAIGYFQLGIPNSQFFFTGNNVQIDSVILSLAYQGYYGDSTSTQRLNVYRVNDPSFNDTTTYYAFQRMQVDPGNLLGTAVVSPRGLEDSVLVDSVGYGPQIRIKLSASFANELLQQTTNGAFFNDSAFHKYLNGLAIVPDTVAGGQSQFLFNLNSTDSKLTVFYKNATTDSLKAEFPFNTTSCGHANYISRNYAGAEVSRYINTNNPAGDSVIYLQDAAGRYISSTSNISFLYYQLQRSPGLFVNIKIPYLKNLPNAIINKAELVLTQIPDGPGGGDDIYAAPSVLFLEKYQQQDTLSNFQYDSPFSLDPGSGVLGVGNLSYFGGLRTAFTNAEGVPVVQYKFNISRYLQHLISEGTGASFDTTQVNNGFRLVTFNPYFGFPADFGRVKLGGGNHSGYRIKLRVIYTKL